MGLLLGEARIGSGLGFGPVEEHMRLVLDWDADKGSGCTVRVVADRDCNGRCKVVEPVAWFEGRDGERHIL